MRTVFHHPFDPACRFVALILSENQLDAHFELAGTAECAKAFATANPALTIPVLVDEPPTGGEIVVAPEGAIAEYIDEAYSNGPLMPATSAGRAETRRLIAWMAGIFENDVNAGLIRPRIETNGRHVFVSEERRPGLEALHWHLDYFNWLLEQRSWIAGEKLTLADFAIAAHVSVLDYFGEIDWNLNNGKSTGELKNWYARMKCRPSFREVLKIRFANIPPPSHYQNPDF
ncbi:MAG: glutathione S-transferase family protein [Pseudomonadota bacterium]